MSESRLMKYPSGTVVQSVSQPLVEPSDGALRPELTVCLGRATYQTSDLGRLTTGSTIVLESMADDPVDIVVNGRLIARGEIVLVDGRYGVRVCERVGPSVKEVLA